MSDGWSGAKAASVAAARATRISDFVAQRRPSGMSALATQLPAGLVDCRPVHNPLQRRLRTPRLMDLGMWTLKRPRATMSFDENVLLIRRSATRRRVVQLFVVHVRLWDAAHSG